jgi:cell division transport system permease protein
MSAPAERIFALRRALSIIARRPGRFLLAVVVCTATFALCLLLAALARAAAPVLSTLQMGPEISVFVNVGVPAGDLEKLHSRLTALDEVRNVRLIPRDEAFAELNKRLGLGDAAEMRPNPLPDALIVRFALTVDPAVVDRAADAVRKWPGVEVVQSEIEWYRRLVAARQAAMPILLIVATLSLLLLTGALVSAALLPTAASSFEAEVLRVVGARASFASRPYAYAGALTLAVGAALALLATWGALRWIAPLLTPFSGPLSHSLQDLQVPAWFAPAMVLGAGCLGGLFAGLAAELVIGSQDR